MLRWAGEWSTVLVWWIVFSSDGFSIGIQVSHHKPLVVSSTAFGRRTWCGKYAEYSHNLLLPVELHQQSQATISFFSRFFLGWVERKYFVFVPISLLTLGNRVSSGKLLKFWTPISSLVTWRYGVFDKRLWKDLFLHLSHNSSSFSSSPSSSLVQWFPF